MPRSLAALVAAAAGFVLPAIGSIWHILSRTAPPTWDDAWYLEVSVRLWDALASLRLLTFAREYAHAFQIKAPLIALQPFPLYLLFGRSLATASLSNLLALAVASVYAFRLGERLHSTAAGVLSVWCLNALPIVYGVSRLFYVECLLIPICLAFVYYLVSGGAPIRLGIAGGLGMLAKVSFPLYVAVPALLLFRRGRDWKALGRAAAAFAATAGTWYAFNLHHILSFALSSSFGAIAQDYGSERGAAAILRYLVRIASECTTWYFLGIALLAGAILILWRRDRLRQIPTGDVGAVLGWILLPLLILSLSVNRESRYAAPALAGLAIALAVVLAELLGRAGTLAPFAASVLFVLPACVYWEQTFGWRIPVDPRGACEARYLEWNGPPRRGGDWGQAALFGEIAADAERTNANRMVVIGLEHQYFNANMASALAALDRWNVSFTSLGYAEASAERALQRLDAMNAGYVVFVDGLPSGELSPHFNQVNDAVRSRLESGPLPFVSWRRRTLANGAIAVVFKRSEARAP